MKKKSIKPTVNERMFKLRDQAIFLGLATSEKNWCDQIGFVSQNINQVKRGKQAFTLDHIHNAVELVECSYDFIFGKIDTLKHKTGGKAEN